MTRNQWLLIIGGCILFLILYGCMSNSGSGSNYGISSDELDRLKNIEFNGRGPEWDNLTEQEKLTIAEMVLSAYENNQHVKLNIEPQDLVDEMETTHYGESATDKSSYTIGAQMAFFCWMEQKMENK